MEPIVVKPAATNEELEDAMAKALIKYLNAYPNNTEAAINITAAEISMTYADVTIEDVRKFYQGVMLYE